MTDCLKQDSPIKNSTLRMRNMSAWLF